MLMLMQPLFFFMPLLSADVDSSLLFDSLIFHIFFFAAFISLHFPR